MSWLSTLRKKPETYSITYNLNAPLTEVGNFLSKLMPRLNAGKRPIQWQLHSTQNPNQTQLIFSWQFDPKSPPGLLETTMARRDVTNIHGDFVIESAIAETLKECPIKIFEPDLSKSGLLPLLDEKKEVSL